MPDIVDPQTRSRMMSGIRGKNTQPELLVRKGLHARGFRFRLHAANVPGRPDLVLARYRAAIFVHGCFWHGHECHLFRLPSTNTAFWREKIGRNKDRDMQVRDQLAVSGWRVMIIWECAIKGRTRLDPAALLDRVAAWLRGDGQSCEIAGAA
ncbi:MAG: very short patch repair endonuclease [Tabrizicola sp.]